MPKSSDEKTAGGVARPTSSFCCAHSKNYRKVVLHSIPDKLTCTSKYAKQKTISMIVKKRRSVAAIKKGTVKKAAPKKATVKKAAPAKAKSAKPASAPKAPLPAPAVKKYKVYIESAAFHPANSADGYVDLFQDGRRTAVAGRSLTTAIVIPVGATLKSISIHYKNTTPNTVLSFFLRKHADRHSPSGEIEMSFINLPPTTLPPDNYLTVTDTTFPNAGVIQDKFLHYIEIPGTGDFGAGGLVTVRGVSLVYTY